MCVQVFGPSANREIIQRSVDLLRFLAKEGELSDAHMDSIWAMVTCKNVDMVLTTCTVCVVGVVRDAPRDVVVIC